MSDPSPSEQPVDFVLDIEFYHQQIDLIIKLIEEGRTGPALHMLRQSKKKFDPIKAPTRTTIIPI